MYFDSDLVFEHSVTADEVQVNYTEWNHTVSKQSTKITACNNTLTEKKICVFNVRLPVSVIMAEKSTELQSLWE